MARASTHIEEPHVKYRIHHITAPEELASAHKLMAMTLMAKTNNQTISVYELVSPHSATVEKFGADECYFETVDGMLLLRRKLQSGRVINIDAMEGSGYFIAHLNMDNTDNRLKNLSGYINEEEARALLMGFEEEERGGEL